MANKVARRSADLTLEIEKGSTFRHKLTWKSGVQGSETPVNLTGAKGRMQIRTSTTAATVLFELRDGDYVSSGVTGIEGTYDADDVGITFGTGGTPDPTDGTIHLFISATNTASFTSWKKGVYSLEIELPNGDVRTLIRGNVSAYDEVTR